MARIHYKVVQHDGGWAYTADGVFSEPFATHDQALVDRMRRRVLELDQGQLVRDEAAGRYTRDESTRDLAKRLRAPSARPPGI